MPRIPTQDPPPHLTPPQFTDNAQRVLAERYLLKDETGEPIETPAQMLWRVARAVAQAEERLCLKGRHFCSGHGGPGGQHCETVYQMACEFYEEMATFRFLPNSPTLANAGKNSLALSGCYVLPVEDSVTGIGEAVKQQMMVHQSGGGTGFSFGRLRPNGSRVQSTSGVASGPVNFMRLFNEATEVIKQGGMRRGANMGILPVDHPDILDFIEAKREGGLSNFNISVAVTDEFMEALNGGGANEGEGYSTRTQHYGYRLRDPRTDSIVGTLSAPAVWRRIAEVAHETGDPGVVFIDRINDSAANPVPGIAEYRIEATNPCGEQPLEPFGVCNLGSINLGLFVERQGEPQNWGKDLMDWGALRQTVRRAVRFLDDVIDVNPYPLQEITVRSQALRRIGLGVMGWADLLYKLRIPYDSEQALALAGQVMKFINDQALEASEQLASWRGGFPLQPRSRYAQEKPRRNAAITTIAPTGTIGIIAGCSQGIEPVFKLAFRHVVGDRNMLFIEPEFQKALHQAIPPNDIDATMRDVFLSGNCQGMHLPGNIERVFKIAYDIAPTWHVRMQAAFQAHTDNGVSKTVNVPQAATIEDIQAIYQQAWDTGCKGVTVFREGSKGGAAVMQPATDPLAVGDIDDPINEVPTGQPGTIHITPRMTDYQWDGEGWHGTDRPDYPPQERHRPGVLTGRTYRKETPLGTAFVNITGDEDGPMEVFVNVGKAGSETAAICEAIGRLLSFGLRQPGLLTPLERAERLAWQLIGIGGDRPLWQGEGRILSVPDAIAQVLQEEVDFQREAAYNAGNRYIGAPGPFAPGGLHNRLNDALKMAAEGHTTEALDVLDGKDQLLTRFVQAVATIEGFPEDVVAGITARRNPSPLMSPDKKVNPLARTSTAQSGIIHQVPVGDGSYRVVEHSTEIAWSCPTCSGQVPRTAQETPGALCPTCGNATLVRMGGCPTCMNPACGYSDC